ncbi:hypothetical protein GPECTOR_207g395 [Gonium pectorale]|uniref:Uncharacterized protein n=1 Tax=Gonium pectorale TaxID=33097 RepID=A0A150FWU6_GONPE|nr:hypothetical protein GPECTOR_207g395 [Gonium pectorale]|eukprot:KXZ42094.1 hypothetical protein GPECTOR_207g395 [Gonium pectorale]
MEKKTKALRRAEIARRDDHEQLGNAGYEIFSLQQKVDEQQLELDGYHGRPNVVHTNRELLNANNNLMLENGNLRRHSRLLEDAVASHQKVLNATAAQLHGLYCKMDVAVGGMFHGLNVYHSSRQRFYNEQVPAPPCLEVNIGGKILTTETGGDWDLLVKHR